MSLDRTTLQQYSRDPQVIQRIVLEEIENANNGEVVLNDPTNPFSMLLEAAATTSSNNIIEAQSLIRKKYPSLAVEADEIYHHITDDHLKSITAQPAEAYIRFFISILDLRLQGYRPTNGGYGEIIIPIGTKVTVVTTTLTLLNDIRVRLYDNGSIFVEQENNSNPISYSDVGIIDTTLWTSNNGTPFISFEVKMKQVTKKSYNYSIISSQGFSKILDITDNFYYSVVSYKNSNTNGQYVYINKSFNEEYINPMNLTCFISLYDKNILYRIPDMYVVSGLLSGNLNIDVYETKGKLYMPLNRYKIEEDYTIELGDVSASAAHAASKNMLIWAYSNDILQGGTNNLTTSELRDEVIEAVVGDMEIPITEKQIEKAANEKGYSIVKSLDVLTERLYIAFKSLPEFNSELLYSRLDCIFSNFDFSLGELKESSFVLNMGDKIILKSNSVFEYSKENGGLKILSDSEYKRLEELGKEQLIDELKDRQLYFNPFYYVIDTSTSVSNVNILSLDKPTITNRRIVDKNNFFNHRVNTSKYSIWKTDKGYRFAFRVSVDENYEQLDVATRGFQVRVKLTTAGTYAYWKAQYDKTNSLWYIDIDSNNEYSDGTIDITNGSSTITQYKRMYLDTEFDIYAYSTSVNLNDTTNFLRSELWTFDTNTRYTVFTKETFTVKLGQELKYLYNKIWSYYGKKPELRYEDSKIMTYGEDIFEVNKAGYKLKFDPGTNKIVLTKTHSKGENVLDGDGNIVYEYKRGDPMLNDSGDSIMDINLAKRTMSLLLFEYSFLKATNSVYQEYLDQMVTTVTDYITDELADLNNKLLEKTEIVFKSSKSVMDVIMEINNNLFSTDYNIKPKITIYSTSKTYYTTQDLDMYRVTIGNIINSYFNKDSIVLEELRQEIKSNLGGDIASVKVSNIESSNSEIIKISNQLNKFTLSKVLEFDANKELIVKYDIEIEVVYI